MQKWSESQKEGAVYTRVLRRILLKLDKITSEKRNPEGYDVREMLELLAKAGYCLNIKTHVAHATDIENRVKYLEGLSTPKQAHEELVTK